MQFVSKRWVKCPRQSAVSRWGDEVDFFVSRLKINVEDIKMHKFPALNLNKNANETPWVLIMWRTSFLLFAKETFQDKQWQPQLVFDVSGFMTLHILLTFKKLKRSLIKALINAWLWTKLNNGIWLCMMVCYICIFALPTGINYMLKKRTNLWYNAGVCPLAHLTVLMGSSCSCH